MRRGEMTKTIATSSTSPEDLAEAMVGRRVLLEVDKKPAEVGETVMQVKGLSVTDVHGVKRLKDVSFELKRGEILGIAGVAGNGQSELLEVIAGIGAATSGEVLMHGEPIDVSKHANAELRRKRGISHVPEDRHQRGLVMPFMTWENTAFGYHNEPEYSGKLGLANQKFMKQDAREKMERFDIRPPNPQLVASHFSGGNQQKIVLAREIERNPDVLLIGQPTRGVDIGAIEFIHQQIVNLRDAGKAILLVSVELDEIQALSDRILVMFDGVIQGERLPEDTNEGELGLLMAGVDPETKQ
jgi:simple sugar transport system ATP-binding protein